MGLLATTVETESPWLSQGACQAAAPRRFGQQMTQRPDSMGAFDKAESPVALGLVNPRGILGFFRPDQGLTGPGP